MSHLTGVPQLSEHPSSRLALRDLGPFVMGPHHAGVLRVQLHGQEVSQGPGLNFINQSESHDLT